MSETFVLSNHDIKIILCYTVLRTDDCSIVYDCPRCPLKGGSC
jgi:hypothetical protein